MLTVQTLQIVEGEPRVRDFTLGVALGFDRPRDVRKVIDRNRSELLAYSGLCATVAQSGGRPATEYWLTEPQALLICMFACTPNAACVRKQVIEVFMAWRRGEVSPHHAIAPPLRYVPRRTGTDVTRALLKHVDLLTLMDEVRDRGDRLQNPFGVKLYRM